MSFKCCLVIQKIAGTLDNRFNNFRHLQYPVSGHLKVPFSYAIKGYGPKQLLSGHHRSRDHKNWADTHHQNCLSSNGITPKTT